MKVVLLAGGLGTRISEESHLKPKPMIEIDGRPILWHIMKSYSHYGYNEFIICCGYKGQIIKQFFADYYLHMGDVTFDFTSENSMTVHNNYSEPWKVTIIDTGLNTMTGGRIKRIKEYTNNEPFMVTYGDGVCDIDINKIEKFHKSHGKIATMTAVQPGGRFGALDIVDETVLQFKEKPKEDGGWINGGFLMFQPEIFNYIIDDSTVLERTTFETLSKMGELKALKYDGFWQCMDTLRDKEFLEELIIKGQAPWKVW